MLSNLTVLLSLHANAITHFRNVIHVIVEHLIHEQILLGTVYLAPTV